MIARREFISLLGGAAAAWPLAARAQQQPAMRRLGVLMNGSEDDPIMRRYLAAFEQPLRPLGWTERQNTSIGAGQQAIPSVRASTRLNWLHSRRTRFSRCPRRI